MIEILKNFIVLEKNENIFEKYSWSFCASSKYTLNFTHKADIADYYLNLSYKNQSLTFEYLLEMDFDINKTNELLVLINFVNENLIYGYFTFNFKHNVIKYVNSKYCHHNLTKDFVLDVIEENLKFTHELFRDFTLAFHNLIHTETSSQDLTDFMFLKIEGHA